MPSYIYNAAMKDRHGNTLLQSMKPSISELLKAPVPPIMIGSIKDITISVIREKDGSEPDMVNLDGSLEPIGRFSKHNANFPVKLRNEINEAVASL